MCCCLRRGVCYPCCIIGFVCCGAAFAGILVALFTKFWYVDDDYEFGPLNQCQYDQCDWRAILKLYAAQGLLTYKVAIFLIFGSVTVTLIALCTARCPMVSGSLQIFSAFCIIIGLSMMAAAGGVYKGSEYTDDASKLTIGWSFGPIIAAIIVLIANGVALIVVAWRRPKDEDDEDSDDDDSPV